MDMRVRSERGNVSASGRRLRLSFVAIVTLLVLVISACANDAPTAGVLTTDEPVADNLRTYAGAISDDLFIGIALATDPDEEVQQQAVMVYLCDGNELSVWLADEFTGQEVILARGDISVTLTITENEISGTVSMNGVLSQSLTAARSTTVSLANVEPDRFTAERGTGDAGTIPRGGDLRRYGPRRWLDHPKRWAAARRGDIGWRGSRESDAGYCDWRGYLQRGNSHPQRFVLLPSLAAALLPGPPIDRTTLPSVQAPSPQHLASATIKETRNG
jgi:hypothetical protein